MVRPARGYQTTLGVVLVIVRNEPDSLALRQIVEKTVTSVVPLLQLPQQILDRAEPVHHLKSPLTDRADQLLDSCLACGT